MGKRSLRHPDNGPLWDRMTNVKQSILKKWDAALAPVKVCCIKFAQKVVQVQTPGPIADPRVSSPLDMQYSNISIMVISLSLAYFIHIAT
jgi:hypothetical protein